MTDDKEIDVMKSNLQAAGQRTGLNPVKKIQN
jgi:hypothetical protein